MSAIIIPPGSVCRPEFDEDNHQYTVNGKKVPSVSRILRPLTDIIYGPIDPEVLRQAADFGTAVHACTELFDLDELDESSVTDAWRPYLDAYVLWKEKTKPEILHIEDRLGCAKYSGTLDRICRIDGELWIIDLKTTAQIHIYGHHLTACRLWLKMRTIISRHCIPIRVNITTTTCN